MGGGSGAMGAAGGSGMGGTGTAASGGSSGASGSASTVGGEGPAHGFGCFSAGTCEPGDRCVVCDTDNVDDRYVERCAPDPDKDSAGYQTATADCIEVVRYLECDGPEDCEAGEYCAILDRTVLSPHCVREEDLPDPLFADCCYVCDWFMCTLCWSDADCPETQVCLEQVGALRGVGGCRPPE
jgi:hypothetical protein